MKVSIPSSRSISNLGRKNAGDYLMKTVLFVCFARVGCLWNLIKLDTFLLNAAVNSRKPSGKAAAMDANGSVTIESASGRLVRSNHSIFRRLKAV